MIEVERVKKRDMVEGGERTIRLEGCMVCGRVFLQESGEMEELSDYKIDEGYRPVDAAGDGVEFVC